MYKRVISFRSNNEFKNYHHDRGHVVDSWNGTLLLHSFLSGTWSQVAKSTHKY